MERGMTPDSELNPTVISQSIQNLVSIVRPWGFKVSWGPTSAYIEAMETNKRASILAQVDGLGLQFQKLLETMQGDAFESAAMQRINTYKAANPNLDIMVQFVAGRNPTQYIVDASNRLQGDVGTIVLFSTNDAQAIIEVLDAMR